MEDEPVTSMESMLYAAESDVFFFSSRRRHTRYWRDWSSDVCSSDLGHTFSYPGLEKRTDLRAVNAREIRARDAVPMQELARTVIENLDQTARRTNGLTPAELALPVMICAKIDRKSTRLNSSHANISYAV